LIPNIGYLSESAASLIDTRLGPLGIVPYTDVAQLASPSFQYPYLDRRAARPTKTRSARALPEKAGSFQCFLNEFRDATVFFRNHPWFDEGGRWNCFGEEGEGEGEGEEAEIRVEIGAEAGAKGARIGRGLGRGERLGRFEWTPALRRQFREQFERMVVLDYLIRNTDRGLDNWMVKYCSKNTVPASADPETQPPMTQMLASQVSATADSIAASASTSVLSPSSPANTGTPRPDGPSFASSSLPAAHFPLPHLHVAAIDNGLAFPYKHPDRWRSYPFGWTHLPHSLVAPPFSHATRAHFLPLLSDPRWWHDTIRAMRNLFAADAGFDEALFRRQVAVLKGQGWNLVKTLKDPRAGPLELVEMPRAVVWEEEVTLIVEEKVTPGQDATERGGEAVAVLGDAGAEGGEKPPDDPDVVSDGPVGAESAPDDDLSPSSERTGSASARSVRSGSTSVSSRDGAAADGRTTRKRWRDRIRRGLRIPVETTTRGEGGLERKATVVVERVQLVPDATPCFTWC
ncbi:phosphatidylinositol 3 and 4-kinase-domain-containing protein, partial [Jimgerdemannia flammicorona]